MPIIKHIMKKAQKKPADKKRVSTKRSRAKTEAIKAFQLVCVLIIVSICISFVIIIGYNNSKRLSPQEISQDDENIEQREQSVVQEIPKIVRQEETKPQEVRQEPVACAPNVQIPESPTATVITSTAVPKTTTPQTTVTPVAAVTASTTRTTEHKGSVAFVIDDAGNNLQELEPFLRIQGSLTIAVLPGLPHSAEAARRIRAAGKEVILHQPMEAIGGQNPGPGAIYSNMSADEIRAILAKNIEEVGPVAGMNNHQGSKITMNREIMEIILAFCAENNLYFLDSRTTAETAVSAAARRLGIKIAERDTFLDNEQDIESMLRFLTSGLQRAQRNGVSVMIGHVQSPALAQLLAEQYPILTIQGYSIKTVSEIIR